MTSYLQRYDAGERVAVWNELHALGSTKSLSDAARLDIDAVARRTIERAHENLATLYRRLCDAGFVFELSEDAFASVPDTRGREIAFLTERNLAIPSTLRAALESIGSVSFRGCPPSGAADFWCDQFLDPFEFMIPELETAIEENANALKGDPEREPGFHLEFAGDYLHKNDVSGGSASMFQLPSDAADALVFEDLGLPGEAGRTPIWFVDYLRAYFTGGGFRRSIATRSFPTEFLNRIGAGLQEI